MLNKRTQPLHHIYNRRRYSV
ncbi:conserved hypothetical protein [Prevotella intermedia]|uniref:Uncharacterized protein n=1 Tax=Prevotella intermedia TaxID=28131 RepID=A0A0S3UHP9_PREIN|nr:conserved hypothetical protein [Prevotella intermedia]